MTENLFYGWYDDVSQPKDKPSYAPPLDAPCPFCGTKISRDDIRTHSILYAEGYARRSYFYRTHRTCDEAAPSGTAMDDFIFDMIKRNGD